MEKKSQSIEIIGDFIIGIVKTFYSISALTQTESDYLISNVKQDEWYPIEQVQEIFSILEKSNRSQPSLMFQAGCDFIQSWYDHVGKELNLGSIGHMKLQNSSEGLNMVMRNFNPEEMYSKVLVLDEEKGICQIETASKFPIHFVKGVFYNGINMWGDLNWLDVEVKQIGAFEHSKKFLIDVRFKLKSDQKLTKKIDDYISNLEVGQESHIDLQMAHELAWQVKGLKQNLNLQKTINNVTNDMLGDALESQHQTFIELTEANNTKNKLFSIIAHDLMSPFNTLINLTHFLIKDYNNHTEEFRKKVIGQLHDSSQNTFTMLSNLLTWSRSQLKTIKLNPVNLCINNLIDSVILITKEASEIKNINVVNKTPEDLYMYADKEMTKTVFRNLITNAIKFTRQNGIIEISAIQDGENIVACVKDNGVGIEPKVLKTIFVSDSNDSTKGTANESGTGLGLLICKEFIEKNNGTIWVESKPDEGSSFYFKLPQATKTPPSRVGNGEFHP